MESAHIMRHNPGEVTLGSPLKCVWMLARVVDYKLCDRQYECEECPFDLAMQETHSSHSHRTAVPAEASNLDVQPSVLVRDHAVELMHIRGYELAGTLFYHPRHIWARIEEGGRVRIGLDDFGQKLLGRVYSITLPEPGTQVSRSGACWWVAHRTGIAMLAAPVTGTVTENNERLLLHPSLINHDPYGQGWSLVIEPEEHLVASLKQLYYGKQVERWYEQEIEKLQEELKNSFASSRPDLGMTLQDGGWQVEGLTRVMPATELRQIIDLFLSASTDHESGSPG